MMLPSDISVLGIISAKQSRSDPYCKTLNQVQCAETAIEIRKSLKKLDDTNTAVPLPSTSVASLDDNVIRISSEWTRSPADIWFCVVPAPASDAHKKYGAYVLCWKPDRQKILAAVIEIYRVEAFAIVLSPEDWTLITQEHQDRFGKWLEERYETTDFNVSVEQKARPGIPEAKFHFFPGAAHNIKLSAENFWRIPVAKGKELLVGRDHKPYVDNSRDPNLHADYCVGNASGDSVKVDSLKLRRSTTKEIPEFRDEAQRILYFINSQKEKVSLQADDISQEAVDDILRVETDNAQPFFANLAEKACYENVFVTAWRVTINGSLAAGNTLGSLKLAYEARKKFSVNVNVLDTEGLVGPALFTSSLRAGLFFDMQIGLGAQPHNDDSFDLETSHMLPPVGEKFVKELVYELIVKPCSTAAVAGSVEEIVRVEKIQRPTGTTFVPLAEAIREWRGFGSSDETRAAADDLERDGCRVAEAASSDRQFFIELGGKYRIRAAAAYTIGNLQESSDDRCEIWLDKYVNPDVTVLEVRRLPVDGSTDEELRSPKIQCALKPLPTRKPDGGRLYPEDCFSLLESNAGPICALVNVRPGRKCSSSEV